MPKSDVIKPSDEKATVKKIPGSEKLFIFQEFPIIQTKEGFWRQFTGDLNAVSSGGKSDEEKLVAVLKFHRYLKSKKSYTVLRFTINMENRETTASNLAEFAREEWARDYIINGFVACQGTCVHGKQCKKTRPVFNNSSPYLKYFYGFIGRGKISLSKRVYQSGPKSQNTNPLVLPNE